MKPPNLSGLLGSFDCSAIDVLTVRRFLGYTVDDLTGRRINGGHDTAVALTAPYSTMSVEGDQTVVLEEFGDRYRDPRWLWASDTLHTRKDDDAPGGESQGDLIVRANGEVYEVLKRQDDQAVTDFRGYLLGRRAT